MYISVSSTQSLTFYIHREIEFVSFSEDFTNFSVFPLNVVSSFNKHISFRCWIIGQKQRRWELSRVKRYLENKVSFKVSFQRGYIYKYYNLKVISTLHQTKHCLCLCPWSRPYRWFYFNSCKLKRDIKCIFANFHCILNFSGWVPKCLCKSREIFKNLFSYK